MLKTTQYVAQMSEQQVAAAALVCRYHSDWEETDVRMPSPVHNKFYFLNLNALSM